MRLPTYRYSNTWQTTLWVTLIVLLSVFASIWFFWRSLYLPELRHHARYLSSELHLIIDTQAYWDDDSEVTNWLNERRHIQVVDNPEDFPAVERKAFVGLFTDIIAKEISAEWGQDTTVYFKFKPSPQLWIQNSAYPDFWLRESLPYYAQYSLSTLLFFLFGIPIFAVITIFILVRQLHRPIRKLQQAATNYIRQGSATTLPTDTGPVEIRQVNTAFNRLFSTLSQAQKERVVMLAGISHDLRTPLTRMRLTAEMLDDEYLKEGLIYDIGDMDAILEQFISFMKDGSDEPISLTDLTNIINEIMVQFAPIEFIYEDNVTELVPLRPLSIKRLIKNLINNAIRYGKPPIYISTTLMPINTESLMDVQDEESLLTYQTLRKAKSKLIISVRDCGDGVPDEQLQRIMQPFERGEAARTTQGSGLGLAIVSRIAGLHQGIVTAYNSEEGGLQVDVTIPLLSQSSPNKSNDQGNSSDKKVATDTMLIEKSESKSSFSECNENNK